MKSLKKYTNFLSIILIVILSFFVLSSSVQALTLDDLFGGNFQTTINLGNNNPMQTIASLIRIALGFIGIIMVVLILLAGFKWMLSGGNEDKISDAKRTLVSAVVGLIIILSAWAVAQFVISSLLNATGAGTGI